MRTTRLAAKANALQIASRLILEEIRRRNDTLADPPNPVTDPERAMLYEMEVETTRQLEAESNSLDTKLERLQNPKPRKPRD